MGVALAASTTLTPTSAFVVAWTHARPTCERLRCRKGAHVHANLSDDHRRGNPIDPWDFKQQRVLSTVGFESDINTLVEMFDVLLYLLQPLDLHVENEAVMVLKSAVEGKLQLRELLTKTTPCQVCHLLRRCFSLDQCFEHQHPR